jgi:hypothetical protein
MVLGSLFAGNYFKVEVALLASTLLQRVDWSAAIESPDSARIFPVVNSSTGELSGTINPYNEYYLVAYTALLANATDAKAVTYFDTYFSRTSKPAGDGTYPVDIVYQGDALLTDNNVTYMSSFIPQFCWFLSGGFHKNLFYAEALWPAWRSADAAFWAGVLDAEAPATVWGIDLSGHAFFGCGAGDSPTGYSVEAIDRSPELVFSAAIMAGFLDAADVADRASINAELRWLYDNLAYETAVGPKVIWRYSLAQPDWRASVADSIDYATMVLGYASNYLPSGFYATFAP